MTVAYDSTAKAITLTGSDPNLTSPTLHADRLHRDGAIPRDDGTSFNTGTGAESDLQPRPPAITAADSFTFTVTVTPYVHQFSPATVMLITVTPWVRPPPTAQTVAVTHDSSGTSITLTGSDRRRRPCA